MMKENASCHNNKLLRNKHKEGHELRVFQVVGLVNQVIVNGIVMSVVPPDQMIKPSFIKVLLPVYEIEE
jgi:hypothetical protein